MKRISRTLTRAPITRASTRATILAAVTVLVATFASAGVASAEVPVIANVYAGL